MRPCEIAQRAARQRLLNSFLRETGGHVAAATGGAPLRVPLPESGAVLLGSLRYWSVLGHHAYRDEFWVQADGSDVATPVNHRELVALLLTELRSVAARAADDELAAQIDNSVARTVRLQMRLTDDRAGVSSGLIYVAAPGGPTVNLQSPRLISGTANDGVWEFTGTVPAYAPAGQWQITQVFVTDRVNRNVLLANPAGLPTLTVRCPTPA